MRRYALVAWLAAAAMACSTAEPRPEATSSPREREPRVARFETGFTVLTVSGVSCDGLEGPWRVTIEAPDPIRGSDRASFRLPNGRGPGRLRWSFDAAHPGHGTATYSGNVKVRAFETENATVLRFEGNQTSVGATAPIVGETEVRFGGGCAA